MQTVRLFPPLSVALQTMNISGRSYAAVPGSVVDVLDSDASVLVANSWVRIGFSGTTAQRPSTSLANGNYGIAAPGAHFFDTTISKLIVFDGAKWRSPVDGSAV